MSFNEFVRGMLCSPLHWLASGRMMLVTVAGRKSGRLYTVPVNYVREGNTVWVISLRERTWWRNLRGGAPATLRLRGRDRNARGEAIEDAEAVVECMQGIPRYAGKYLGIAPDKKGRAKRHRPRQSLESRVLVRFDLGG